MGFNKDDAKQPTTQVETTEIDVTVREVDGERAEREERYEERRKNRERRRGRNDYRRRDDFNEDDWEDDGKGSEFEEREERRQTYRTGRNFRLNPTVGASKGSAFKKCYDELHKDIDKSTMASRLILPLTLNGDSVQEDLTVLIYASQIESMMYAHAIILESKTNPVKVKRPSSRRDRDRYRNSDIEVKAFRSTYDGVNLPFQDRVCEEVANEMGVELKDVTFTDATIVPALADVSDEAVVQRIVYLADNSNFSLANADASFTPDALRPRSTVRALLTFNQENDGEDLLGLPTRKDFDIEVNETTRDNHDDGITTGSGERNIATISGFVNAGFVGDEEEDRRDDYRRRLDNGCYAPEIIVSSTDTFGGMMMGSELGRGMLALSAIAVLNTNGNYLRPFEENTREENRSVSAFAYGMNWESYDNPNGDLPDVEELERVDEDPKYTTKFLRNMFITDDADVVYMVTPGGDSSILGKLFLDIGEKNKSAAGKFVAEMDELTDGAFTDFLEDDSKFRGALRPDDIVTSIVRVPTGYVKGGSRDSRFASAFIDTQWVCNRLKGNNPELLMDWFDATSTESSMFSREEADTRLLRVLDEVTGGMFVHTGFAYKVYLSGRVVQLMYDAVQDSEVAPRIDTDGVQSQRYRQRGRRHESDRLRANSARTRRDNYRDEDRRRSRRGSFNYRY